MSSLRALGGGRDIDFASIVLSERYVRQVNVVGTPVVWALAVYGTFLSPSWFVLLNRHDLDARGLRSLVGQAWIHWPDRLVRRP